jgi:hypothetical protein
MTQLERLLPRYHFAERHAIEIDAPPERALAAVREATFAEMPLARLLFRLRGLRSAGPAPVFDHMPDGFAILAEEPNRELVVGGLGQPWKLTGGRVPRAEFTSFDEPGFAKMAMNFLVDGRTLSTETRVLLTDAASGRDFARYWLLVRPFSALIRRLWLRAAKRRAEAAYSPR